MTVGHELVVVTGASRGIGRALAAAFAAEGHPVLVTARSSAAAEAAATSIAQDRAEASAGAQADADVRIRGLALDVTDPQSVARFAHAVAQTASDWDAALTTLVNNAGVVEASEGPLWDADIEDVASVIDTNLTGVFRVVHALLPALLSTAETAQEPVRIINLNSGSGAQGTSSHAAYSASKTGLFRLTQSLVEYGHDRGLRVFEMAPGVVESDMTKSMPMHDHRTGDDWTDPQDVAALALALASGRFDALTGRYVRAGADSPESLADAAAATTAADLRDGFRFPSVRMQ